MRIPHEQIERIRVMLKEAPEAPTHRPDATKQETVRLLIREILALQGRGYSLEQVAEIFKTGGVGLTTPTLKSYLSRAKGGRRPRRAGQRTKTGGGAKAPAPVVVAPRPGRVVAPGGEKKDTTAVAKPRPPSVGDEDRNQEGAPDGSKLLSGKDAFLIKDKVEY